ncbi:MAG: hypothetical protein K8S87_12695, partial [Planctomycetes bacterium]|nr:hypothetical protein [Planctomycetota bacterium]
MKKKTIIAATNNNETYDFILNITYAFEHWNLKRLGSDADINQHVLRKDVDLLIIDSEYITPQVQEILLSPKNKTHYIVILRESTDIEALSWIHKGACGFLHEPTSEVSEESATFVIKSIFRCSKVKPERLKQISCQQHSDS